MIVKQKSLFGVKQRPGVAHKRHIYQRSVHIDLIENMRYTGTKDVK